jgi:hypothetical protein
MPLISSLSFSLWERVGVRAYSPRAPNLFSLPLPLGEGWGEGLLASGP